MVIQDSQFKGVAEYVSFFEEIYRSVFIFVNAIFIDSLKTSLPVESEEFLPACYLAVAGPVLAAESSLLICSDIVVQ